MISDLLSDNAEPLNKISDLLSDNAKPLNVISDLISVDIPPQVKILNMVIPILMHFCSFLSN